MNKNGQPRSLADRLKIALCDSEWVTGGWAQVDGIVAVVMPIVEGEGLPGAAGELHTATQMGAANGREELRTALVDKFTALAKGSAGGTRRFYEGAATVVANET